MPSCRRIVSLIIAAFWTLVQASADNSHALRIGIAESYAPLSDVKNGEPFGYLVDLIQELERHLDYPIEIVTADWPELEEQVQNGKIDTLFGLYYSEARSQTYTFGPEIFSNQVCFFARPNSNVRSLTEASGNNVAIAGPESYILRYVQEHYPEVDWIVFEDFPTLLKEVRNSPDIIGWVEEEAVVQWTPFPHRSATIDPTGAPILERPLRPVSLKNRPEVMQKISEALEKIDTSTIKHLQSIWLNRQSSINKRPFHPNPNGRILLDDQELAFLKSYPMIRYAGDPSWPPISSRGEDGKLQGIQHDVLRLISERTGLQLVFPSFSGWTSVRSSLNDGLADLRSGNRDEARSSISYLSLPLVLAARKDNVSGYNLSMYSNRKISIEAGNTYANKLKALYPKVEFVKVASDEKGFEAVTNGIVEGHIGNYAICAHLLQYKFAASIVIVDTLEEKQNLAFTIADDPNLTPLLSILNKGINSITEEELLAIQDRWINIDIRQVKDYSSYWKAALGIAVCLSLAVLLVRNVLRMRNALVKAKERILLANKAGAGGMFEWFPKEHRVRYSPEFFRVLGYDEDELPQSEKTLLRISNSDDIKRIIVKQHLCTRKGKEYAHKIRMQRRDGRWTWIVMRGIPTHFYKDGSVKRYIGVQMDVSTLQAAIEKQREQEEIAHKANQAKSDFLANMSHEIRTPMNAILGFSRLLSRETTLSIQQKEFAHLIQSSSEHLLSLLDDILDMAKIESQSIELIEQRLDLSILLNETSAIFKSKCQEKGLEFETQFAPDLPVRIVTDGTKLRQIIFNLLSNAVKFTDNGTISLNASLKGEQLWIQVTDTGCGISKDDQAKLFNAFTQGEAGQNNSTGTGLGLVICREYCRLMGGDIHMQSEIGDGSSFGFTVDYARADEAEKALITQPVKIPYKSASTKRVLVVDDKLYNLQYLERFLSEQGFSVDLAQDGEEALESWAKNSPDILLLDIRMPKVDGYEVVKQIRNSESGNSNTKILALTASAFNEQRQRILDLGADAFMTKPFDELKLIRLLAELLDLPLVDVQQDSDQDESLNERLAKLKLSKQQSDELIQACLGGYVEKIQTIIDSLATEQPDAAAALLEIALNFDYERVIKIANRFQ
ncbi:transporter substrate-binding domain-containing protein [Puniceicoccaceae bacterium K14]|nr:transporter substrate-binding domain-containing protein [Puniceicoccaceae bacterium K14]